MCAPWGHFTAQTAREDLPCEHTRPAQPTPACPLAAGKALHLPAAFATLRNVARLSRSFATFCAPAHMGASIPEVPKGRNAGRGIWAFADVSRRCWPLSLPSLLPSHAHLSPSPPVQHGRPVCHSSHRRYRRFALLHHEHSVSEFASTSLAPGDAQFTPAPDIAVNRPLSAISRRFHGLAAHVRSSYSLHVFA